MKKLFLALFFFLFTFNTVTAQEYTESSIHGNWKYLYGTDYMFLYSIKGVGVENFSEIPDFTIRIELADQGIISIRLDGALVYTYDKEGKKNYVKVDIIIDNSDIMTFNGEIRGLKWEDDDENKTKHTRIYLSKTDDSPKFLDLFEDMKTGNEIFVRTTGSGDPIVFKYSLSGFYSGFKKLHTSWESWKETQNNPFKKDNPFNKY